MEKGSQAGEDTLFVSSVARCECYTSVSWCTESGRGVLPFQQTICLIRGEASVRSCDTERL